MQTTEKLYELPFWNKRFVTQYLAVTRFTVCPLCDVLSLDQSHGCLPFMSFKTMRPYLHICSSLQVLWPPRNCLRNFLSKLRSSTCFLVYSGLLLRTYVQDLRTGIRTMPPLRRRSRVQDKNMGAEARATKRLFDPTTTKLMPTEEDCLHRQQGHSFESATRFWSPSHGFKCWCKRPSARNKWNVWFGTCSPPRPCGEHQRERFHLLGRTIKYNSTTGSGVYRCCLEGNRQWSRSGRRSGFTTRFLANSFKFQSRHASHWDCRATANSKSIGYMSTCGAISEYSCSIREGYTVSWVFRIIQASSKKSVRV